MKMKKFQVVCWSADTWEVEATDAEEAAVMVENGEGTHVSGSFCHEPDFYDAESGEHVIVGGSDSDCGWHAGRHREDSLKAGYSEA
jgi:hypothetical protein